MNKNEMIISFIFTFLQTLLLGIEHYFFEQVAEVARMRKSEIRTEKEINN